MTTDIKTTEAPKLLSPIEQATKVLENRQKRLDILNKIDLIKSDKVKFQQEENKREVDIEEVALRNEEKRAAIKAASDKGNLYTLIIVATAVMIDTENQMPGSEMKLKSLLEPDEIATVKNKILEIVKKMK